MLSLNRVSKKYGKKMAVDNVCLEIKQGESFSLTGESGSGKSTLSRMILALENPNYGNILWQGKKVSEINKKELYRDIQPVFQDNYSCFNPRRKISESLYTPMKNLIKLNSDEMELKAVELLNMVGIHPKVLNCYPHELSGGQQKRICIARALSVNPRLIILDEALSGLDSTVAVRILKLLEEISNKTGCAYLFITHDIRMARYLSRRIGVMKEGCIEIVIEKCSGGNYAL